MPLREQTKINHYIIQSMLGAGGMGEVYKGLDTRLGRLVALKILPANKVDDPDRLHRFMQEARSASALNHPNIVTIYDIGKAQTVEPPGDPASDQHWESGNGGAAPVVIDFIAMEFVDGVTLREKIHREKSEVPILLEYLAQTANGLARAHASGIIHRDLKPDNIMITREGFAKILDFGLAKLVEPTEIADRDSEDADTALMGLTKPGVIIGTAGYMSPEQVLGKALDHRSDIFSLGCILYEAATGRGPFGGATLIDSLHKIVHGQPQPVRDIYPDAPADLERILSECLAKNPGQRYQSAKQLAADLRSLAQQYDSTSARTLNLRPQSVAGKNTEGPVELEQMPGVAGGRDISGPGSSAVSGDKAVKKTTTLLIPVVSAASIIIFIAVYIFLSRQKPHHGSFQTGRMTRLTATGKTSLAAISPDGKYAVHSAADAGQESLWLRHVQTSSNIELIPARDVQYRGLTFSPDGAFIYYVAQDKGTPAASLFKLPVLGGQSRKIIDNVASPLTFAPDGSQIAFVRNVRGQQESGLVIANSDGSGERKLAALRMPDVILAPAWSPDGATIACVKRQFDRGLHCVVAGYRVSDGRELTLSQRWGSVDSIAWLSDGKGLVITAADQAPIVSKTQIWQVSYPDGRTARITNDLNSYSGISLSTDSSALVTVQKDTVSKLWVVPVGDPLQVQQITSSSSLYTQPAWVSTGRILCSCDSTGNLDIWVMDSDGKNQHQLTSDAGVNGFPQVSRDGKLVVFTSNRAGDPGLLNIWTMNIDGSNQRQLTNGQGELFPYPAADGNWVFYNPMSEVVRRPSLWKVALLRSEGVEAGNSLQASNPVQASDGFSVCPVLSPDSKFIALAYWEGASATPVLAVMPVQGGPPIAHFDVGLTVDKLVGPSYRWSADSKGLLYELDRGGVTNIWYQPLPSGAPKQVTDFKTGQIFYFDGSTDGKRLVCARGSITTDVVLITNHDLTRTP
jgi:serine/threonine protein kinase/Tol biopolymer transport system component